MSSRRSPFDLAVDLFVYAPVGLLVTARDLLPALVEKGRETLGGQVATARVVGELAVRQGQSEASKALARAREQAAATLEGLGVAPEGAEQQAPVWPGAEPAPAAERVGGDGAASAQLPDDLTEEAATAIAAEVAAEVREAGVALAEEADEAGRPEAGAPEAPAPSANELAIPDYDSLSASQVVPRLSGLSTEELDAVRAYEAAHRQRKTILNRVAQLQGR